MPKNRVTTSYTKAATSPGRREKPHDAFAPQMRVPTPLSPLAAYVEENSDSGLTEFELIKQFQEYDCPHPAEHQEKVISTSTFWELRCNDCRWTRKKLKPGVKE